MTDTVDLEALAGVLDASGNYRILRRLKPWRPRSATSNRDSRCGLLVDVETTGLNVEKDEIIELAMLPFRYTLAGEVVDVLEPFDRLRQPLHPIPEVVATLTGITNEMVAGKTIDLDEVAAIAAQADLIIAHNAAFDRRFLERLAPVFAKKPWACSLSEIDWVAEGFEGTKLAYLVAGYGLFYDRHRATNDCLAAIEILSRILPKSGVTGLAQLLVHARRSMWRIWATNAPFEFKDILKSRNYRWNGEENGRPRAWYVDVSDEEKDAEINFLWREIYKSRVELNIVNITAYDRYSDRV
ncbi:3'-5' exonuclease [Hyphomicrobium sp. CS1BSMeth3]|uniref:3'-5' exonuclease n=1 Tax=Hyphomicrobium sp. CS1BSMeth3 TaxID=1892844 RepID=UPI0009301F03|nr:3'-5' exonuclease [Hyphomicrobium sp. CS1BSMeth3]